MRRRLAFVFASTAALLGSCQSPAVTARAVFIDGRLAFVDAEGEDHPSWCWRGGVVIDDRLQPLWRFERSPSGKCGPLFPLFYGRAPDNGSGTDAVRLEPGRLYLLLGDATAEVEAAFAFSRAGKGLIVHNVDPDSPAAAALKQRYWSQPPKYPPLP